LDAATSNNCTGAEYSMIDLFSKYRGSINTLLVLSVALLILCNVFFAFRKSRTSVPSGTPIVPSEAQGRRLAFIDAVGAIGTGVLWTVLVQRGPSLAQLWLGARGVSHWLVVLLYTMVWLQLSRIVNHGTPVDARTTFIVRAILFAVFFFGAMIGLNDW
jgi:hypothetical protein